MKSREAADVYDNEPERIYEAACRLVHQGISVIPMGSGISKWAKEPHKQALIASGHTYQNDQDEARASWKPMQFKLPTQADLATWYLQARARGLGMVTGEISDHIVIDCGTTGWLQRLHGSAPPATGLHQPHPAAGGQGDDMKA
ncbi:hypothetical protein D3875_03435 [Deinococcus cavernae]|uniref:Uncharacterized protein n=1 Tax=Deinococcus cavernae TaxID=2320857 RepID=A0A418VET3_9DEIO|nr:hypothetical protein [Deinococcus cavernae]RJF74607.1 hypothetical protein D3875_03435 [Deinococcus cavernae]